MSALSVIVITRDEAAHIRGVLDSVAWADERIVVDSGSTDGTVEIAREVGARVEVRDWPGYGAQKNHAASLASHDWILSLDADERVTPALADEIRQTLQSGPEAAGYRIPRVTYHLGRWIRTTDWYPDWQLRLYDRRRARWSLDQVHESVQPEGGVLRLRGELQHYAYRDVSHHIATIDKYTTLAAARMAAAGKTSSPGGATLQAAAAFLRNYLLRRGITQGATGFVISATNAYYVWLKHVKLWELGRPDPPASLGVPERSRREHGRGPATGHR